MLTALVLVCSLATTPNLANCDQDSARDVVRVAETFENPTTCLMHGQAYVAQTAIGRELDKDETIKVVCTRTSKVGATARLIAPR